MTDGGENEEENDTASDYSGDDTPVRGRTHARAGSYNPAVAVTTKSARAHAKSYRPGPPLVPQMILKKVLEYVQKVVIQKKQPFVERLCRYWSLKREARRGAPLLKRLHLEVSYNQDLAESTPAMDGIIGISRRV
jgi:NuA3 HAT complex component NTO1